MKKVLIRPIITEKTLQQAEKLNQYTFLVNPDCGKLEVEKAIETKFDVKVNKVRVVNVLGKNVKFGRNRTPGQRSNFKKAVVTLKKGDKIGIFDLK